MKEERILPDYPTAWENIYEEGFLSPSKDAEWIINTYSRFIDFMQQPLKLSDFIPCNEKGEPIKKPDEIGEFDSIIGNINERLEYKQALERTIFEGFEEDERGKYKDSDYIRYSCKYETKEQIGQISIYYDMKENRLIGNRTISDLKGKVSVRVWKWNELKLGK